MPIALPEIADELGADERTLRRAAQRGTIRAHRPSPRRLELPAGERAYLRANWDLLHHLTRALRTEPNVRLAVLYGSTARGDARRDSDVDVLIDFRDDRDGAASHLARRLEGALGKPVDVARLSRVRKQSPLLLLAALEEGRVLVDREDGWCRLRAQRESIARSARRHAQRSRAEAAASIARLSDGLS